MAAHAMRDAPWLARLGGWLEAPVSARSLCAFRVLFGAVMCCAMLRFIALGWVDAQYIRPSYHFPYAGFDWLRPWPGVWMRLQFAALVVFALGVAFGVYYRACALALAASLTYVELLDKAVYLNHYYLACLLAWMLVWLPAAGMYSYDAWRDPARRITSIPRWALLALRVQVAVVYVFAGLAKLNADWLLRAQPLRIWLAARSDLPLIGWLLAQPATAYLASWAGAAFDLGIVGLLSWRRTRAVALVAAVVFHALTGVLLPIGMFPWIMLACITLLLPADWPQRLRGERSNEPQVPARLGHATAWLFALHCSVQLIVPLHQRLAHADTAWSVMGFNFAWNVMLVEKAGSVRYVVRDLGTGEERFVEPGEYVTRAQESAMAQDPEMIRSLAQRIARDARAKTGHEVAVYAQAFATLNGRPARRLIDPAVDLAQQGLKADWILPLH